MKSATVGEKGHILIPVQIRRKFGLKRGTRVIVSDDGETIRVTPITEARIRKMAGVLKGFGDLTDALLKSRTRERAMNR